MVKCMAGELMSAINNGVEILLRDVFAAPTVDGLAQIITRTLALSDAERRKARAIYNRSQAIARRKAAFADA